MGIIIEEIMQMLEITNIQYLYVIIGVVFGGLILWRLRK